MLRRRGNALVEPAGHDPGQNEVVTRIQIASFLQSACSLFPRRSSVIHPSCPAFSGLTDVPCAFYQPHSEAEGPDHLHDPAKPTACPTWATAARHRQRAAPCRLRGPANRRQPPAALPCAPRGEHCRPARTAARTANPRANRSCCCCHALREGTLQ